MLLTQSLIGPQIEEGAIPEAVAMEMAIVVAVAAELVVELAATTTPEPRVEIQVDP
jgi:hypothetical protein